jgi:hypothetical protein
VLLQALRASEGVFLQDEYRCSRIVRKREGRDVACSNAQFARILHMQLDVGVTSVELFLGSIKVSKAEAAVFCCPGWWWMLS